MQSITASARSSNIPALSCDYTWLYNQEDADDKSIIRSTITATSTLETATSVYPVIFTVPGTAATVAATAAAATPSNPLQASLPNLSNSSTNLSNSTFSNNSSSDPLSIGSIIGIGIGVAFSWIALVFLVVFLFRTLRKRIQARLHTQDAHVRLNSQDDHAFSNTNDEAFSPSDSYVSGFETKKNEDIVADTSGLHELDARKTPENFVREVHEMKEI